MKKTLIIITRMYQYNNHKDEYWANWCDQVNTKKTVKTFIKDNRKIIVVHGSHPKYETETESKIAGAIMEDISAYIQDESNMGLIYHPLSNSKAGGGIGHYFDSSFDLKFVSKFSSEGDQSPEHYYRKFYLKLANKCANRKDWEEEFDGLWEKFSPDSINNSKLALLHQLLVPKNCEKAELAENLKDLRVSANNENLSLKNIFDAFKSDTKTLIVNKITSNNKETYDPFDSRYMTLLCDFRDKILSAS